AMRIPPPLHGLEIGWPVLPRSAPMVAYDSGGSASRLAPHCQYRTTALALQYGDAWSRGDRATEGQPKSPEQPDDGSGQGVDEGGHEAGGGDGEDPGPDDAAGDAPAHGGEAAGAANADD